jgi:cytosolic carboxypeptidase protein 6
LKYINASHRYFPKISYDRNIWDVIDTSDVKIDKEDHSATFRLDLNNYETYISAQEIINSSDIESWNKSLKSNELVSELQSIGTSPLGKNLNFFRIGNSEYKGKKVIVLTTRMHPPEISGFKAFQSFIETILADTMYSDEFFKKYELWVFPCLNPDGVDLGHWRHNYNGVDLNRDWAFYRQPEINIITKYIVERAKKFKNKIVLSLDFHSTSQDIYYVFDDKFRTKLKDFPKKWTKEIDKAVFPFKTIYSLEPMGKPYSKTWFYKQFKAESITYEVGDETDRNIISKKAEAAALSMMKLLKR